MRLHARTRIGLCFWLLFSCAALARAADGDDDGDGLSNEREQQLGTRPDRIDSDGDYLTDAEEVERGTDPREPDTDQDGLPDYSEIAVHGTDPLRKDTDGGGTIDGQEVRIDGTNATDPKDDRLDSDDDGLSNAQERALATDPFAPDSDHDLLADGDEDANHNGVHDAHETDPTRADTDADGVPDGVEVLVYHSDPFEQDSDGDGLTDGMESALRARSADCLDPAQPDSDHDGLSDGQELSQPGASDPCQPDGDGDGIYDAVERSDGTDPGAAGSHVADADGDHLSDRYEAMVSHTDPAAADSDGDGLDDGEELFELVDLRITLPNDADSDDDGLLDGSESRIAGGRLQPGTDPLRADSDADGLLDAQELGRASPELSARDADATRSEVFRADLDPGTRTDPLLADSDGDGLLDGEEDADHDGQRAARETDPLQADSDGDGLDDGWETRYARIRDCQVDPLNAADARLDADADGLSNRQEYRSLLRTAAGTHEVSTNPCAADSDADGLTDPEELRSDYGGGQSDPTLPDSDGDGLPDGLEDRDRDGRWQNGAETDPTRADTDGDHLLDGAEDADHDGERGLAETDPTRADSDEDGLDDGQETQLFGTDPTRSDSDGDLLPDGLELALQHDADPLTSTDPRLADTDGDGIADGVEDANHDGAVDADETHPRLPDTDGDGLGDGEEDSDHDGIWDASRGESDPRRPDTDGAGVDDGTELRSDHTDPNDPRDDLSADPDADGLVTRVELALHTDPLAADSDGDFVSDGEEVGADQDAPVDFDNDGVIDALDTDSDADSVPDALEAGDEDLRTPRPDTDHDGQNDLQDVDSDNGGVPDGTEQYTRHTDRLDARDDGRGWFEVGSSVRGSGCAVAVPGARSHGWWLLCAAWCVRRARRRRSARQVLGLLGLFWASSVQAQEHPDARQTAVDGSPYRMNPSGDSVLSTSLPSVLAHLQWQLRLGLHHFADSIVVADASGGVRRSILDNRQQLELGAALGLFDRFELSAHWAVAPHQSATFPGAGLGATDSAGVTHPVLHPKWMLLRGSALGIGIEAPLTLALWQPQAYLGRDGWSVRPAALVSWQWRALTAAVSAGVDLLPAVRIYHTRDGSRFVYQAALQYGPAQQPWSVGLEWSASHRLAKPWDRDEQTGQLALGFAYRLLRAWTLQASVGAGVLGGIGQPQYRVLASAAYRASPPQPSAASPSAPARVEPPPPAITAPEPVSPAAAPTPVAPAVAEAATEPGPPPPPSAAELQAFEQPIRFAVSDSAFDAESLAQLDRVLAVLEAHPALRVRLEGHTDALGDGRANDDLSLRRAQAARDYLVQHSRSPEALAARIETVGHGERQPADSNDTEAGRARNRRVTFVVLTTAQ